VQPESTTTIESPTGGLRVTIEDHGEHHMGCRTLEFVPDRPLAGVSRFRTTNGAAFFTPAGDGLVIHDACVILFFDLAGDRVFHFATEKRQLVEDVRLEGGALAFDLSDGRGSRAPAPPVSLADISSVLAAGPGRVADGRFPSAYP